MTIPALVRWYDYVKTKDRAVLWDALHPDAVFESPVVHMPQHGREITFISVQCGEGAVQAGFFLCRRVAERNRRDRRVRWRHRRHRDQWRRHAGSRISR